MFEPMWSHTPEPLKKPDGKLSHFYVDDIEPQIKKDSSGDTVGVVKGKTDLYKQIYADKDNCGLAYILRLVAEGRKDFEDLEDDVDKNGDFGGNFIRPTMVSEAAPILQADAQHLDEVDSIAKKLGVSRKELLECKDLNALIQSKFPPKEPAKEVKKDGE